MPTWEGQGGDAEQSWCLRGIAEGPENLPAGGGEQRLRCPLFASLLSVPFFLLTD